MSTADAAARQAAQRVGLASFALILCAVFMFAALDAIAKLLSRDYPVPMIAWARYSFHLVIFGAVTWFTHGPAALVRTRRVGLHVLRGLLLAAVTLLFMSAIAVIPLAEATAIAFVTPLLVTVLSVPILGERVGPHRWAAVALGFAGMLIILRPGGAMMHWASLLALGMAFCYAGYQIATRVLNRTEAPLTTITYTALVGTAATSLIVPFYWQTPEPAALALMATTGILGGGGHFLLILALRQAPASALAPFSYLQLVFAAGFGFALFGDVPDGWTVVGAALITAGGLWTWHRERLHAKREESR